MDHYIPSKLVIAPADTSLTTREPQPSIMSVSK